VTEEEAIKVFKEDHPYLNDISDERVKEIGFTTMAYLEQLEKDTSCKPCLRKRMEV
jgi:hypothetical protein